MTFKEVAHPEKHEAGKRQWMLEQIMERMNKNMRETESKIIALLLAGANLDHVKDVRIRAMIKAWRTTIDVKARRKRGV